MHLHDNFPFLRNLRYSHMEALQLIQGVIFRFDPDGFL